MMINISRSRSRRRRKFALGQVKTSVDISIRLIFTLKPMLVCLANFLKTWSMKITAILLELGQTRLFISPMSPKITEKGKGARAREKKTSNSHSQEHQGRFLRATWFSKNPGLYIYKYLYSG